VRGDEAFKGGDEGAGGDIGEGEGGGGEEEEGASRLSL